MNEGFKKYLKITALPVLFAGLCCFSPIVLFLLGVSSLTVASSFADTLYGEYKWYFRLAGLLVLAIALFIYFRKKGVCTIDQAKRRRTEIINTILVSLFVSIVAYILWLYVVVHYWGVFLGLWI